jgi:hypothetical protein
LQRQPEDSRCLICFDNIAEIQQQLRRENDERVERQMRDRYLSNRYASFVLMVGIYIFIDCYGIPRFCRTFGVDAAAPLLGVLFFILSARVAVETMRRR